MRRAVFVLAAAVLPAAALAQSTDLKRLTLRNDTLGWEAVGRLDIGQAGFCTGALVAGDLVLTAAHCLFDPGTGERLDPRDMVFRAALSDDVPVAERRGRRAVVHEAYDYTSSDGAARIRHDVALLQLDAPISVADADPFRTDSLSGSGRVSVVSYALGREAAPSRQGVCQVLGAQEGLVAFDCYVNFGSSGAPVFQERGGRMRIVSVISAVTDTDDGPVSLGMDLSGVYGDLVEGMRAGRGVWPDEGAEARRLLVGSHGGNGARFLKP